MERIRERGGVLTATDTNRSEANSRNYLGCKLGSWYSEYNYVRNVTYELPHEYQKIMDYGGPFVPNKFNFVDNWKYSYSNNGPMHTEGYYSRFGNCSSNHMGWHRHAVYPLSSSAMLALWEAEMDRPESFLDTVIDSSDMARAVSDILPSSKDFTTNMVAFLLEIGDLRSLIPGILKSLSPGKPLERGAQGWLSDNFAVTPTLGDFDALTSGLSSLRKKVEQWNQLAAKGTIMNFHRDIIKSRHIIDRTEIEVVNEVAYPSRTITYSGYGEFSAKLHLYIRPRPIPDHVVSRLWTIVYDFSKPLTGIWEAIPFSWFVDYLLGVQKFLERLEDDTLDECFRYDVLDGGYSTHKVGNLRYHHQVPYYSGGRVINDDYISFEHYKRHPLDPNFFDPSSFELEFESNFTPRRTINVLAVGYLSR